MKNLYRLVLIISLFIFCLLFFSSPSQCQYGYPYGYNYFQPPYYGSTQYYGYGPSPGGLIGGPRSLPMNSYGGYGYPYGGPPNYGYGGYGFPYGRSPNYGYGPGYYNNRQPYSNQPYYGAPYAGYGWNQPYNYGGYPYQSGGYNWGAGGYYPNSNYPPYQYFGDPYTQQNPYYNPLGVFSGDWENWPYLPSMYKDADVTLDEGDNGDDITVDKGDSIAIILPSMLIPGSGEYEWALDTGELDYDIISHRNISEWFSGYQFWVFEAEDVGTTTIRIGNISWIINSSIGEDVFEVEVTVED